LLSILGAKSGGAPLSDAACAAFYHQGLKRRPPQGRRAALSHLRRKITAYFALDKFFCNKKAPSKFKFP